MFLSCEICSYPWRFMVVVFYNHVLNEHVVSVKSRLQHFTKEPQLIKYMNSKQYNTYYTYANKKFLCN